MQLQKINIETESCKGDESLPAGVARWKMFDSPRTMARFPKMAWATPPAAMGWIMAETVMAEMAAVLKYMLAVR
jgi:hypothetical protein